jgi:hypothetical protein
LDYLIGLASEANANAEAAYRHYGTLPKTSVSKEDRDDAGGKVVYWVAEATRLNTLVMWRMLAQLLPRQPIRTVPTVAVIPQRTWDDGL